VVLKQTVPSGSIVFIVEKHEAGGERGREAAGFVGEKAKYLLYKLFVLTECLNDFDWSSAVFRKESNFRCADCARAVPSTSTSSARRQIFFRDLPVV
jgi:hypothetical protein